MSSQFYKSSIGLVLIFAITGCSSSSGSSVNGNNNQNTDDLFGSVALTCDSPVTTSLRRLSNLEYDNTVSDLIGEAVTPSTTYEFPGDNSFKSFRHLQENLPLGESLILGHLQAAEDIANRAVESSRVMICAHTGPVNGCTNDIAKNFVSRAFRRPATNEEVQELMNKAAVTANESPDAQANLHRETIKQLVKHTLLHPKFLFHWEGYEGEGKLEDWELASRLSFFFLRSQPDDALWEDLVAGKVWDNYTEHVLRYLNDPSVVSNFLHNFVGQWLGNNNVDSQQIDPALKRDMQRELVFMFQDLLISNQDVREIFKPGYTYLNANLADHYGINESLGANFSRVSTQERGNLLTMAAFISASENRPTNRGIHVYERILCKEVGAPTGIDISGLIPQGTFRETILQLSTMDGCSECHSKIDPLGFGLDQVDALGRWRTLNILDEPVDSTGSFRGQNFSDHDDLGEILSTSPEFPKCVAEKMLSFALSKAPDEADQCHVDSLEEKMKLRSYKFGDIILDTVYSGAFFYKGRAQ